MNNENYFHSGPALRFSRNRFNMPFQHSTAYNAGDIVPLMTDYIYPGDSWKTKLSFLTRMFTPIAPVMSNMYQDFYAFFVPWRIVWEHTKQFFGENETGAWTAALDRLIPQHPIDEATILSGTAAQFPNGAGVGHTVGTPGWYDQNGNLPAGSIGDYMGIVCPEFQSAAEGNSISDLFRRAYLQVYNDWFRDENIIDPVLFSKGDTQAVGESVFYWSPCLKAAKFHDYFTSLLPEAMKGPVPTIGDMMPVVTGSDHVRVDDETSAMNFGVVGSDGSVVSATDSRLIGYNPNALGLGSSSLYKAVYTENEFSTGYGYVPSNLWAKVNITIEDIRKASVITHIFEKLAVCGSRYPEFLQGMWGVISPDASLQVSEYLGGVRFPIRIQEVLSNSDTLSADQSSGQPIGQTGAMSKTGQSGELFNKSFTEYGILLCVGVLRVEQTYFQGVARKFLNKSFFDFYLPAAANIGNQPVYIEELYARDQRVTDQGLGKVVLGYSEAYAYLRYLPWRLSSIMKPNAENGLSWWTATEVLDEPDLDQTFIEQGTTGLDRTIAIGSANRGAFQFFGDFRFDNDVTRILPDHSRPGLTRI